MSDTITITDPEELGRTEIRVGDLVTERVTDVGSDTDNGYYDGQVVRIEREAPATPAPTTRRALDARIEEQGKRIGDALARSLGATPAPLDPSKVKAGDTVTLESGTALVRDVVAIADHYADGSRRLLTSEPPVQAYRVGPGAWTLTDHQPAPEPEPEWKPGTTGTATVLDTPGVRVMRTDGTVNGVDIAWVSAAYVAGSRMHHAPQVTDFVPDEPRPLPTRDRIRDALRAGTAATYPGSVEKPWDDIDSMTRRHYDQMTDAVEALLRGEVR